MRVKLRTLKKIALVELSILIAWPKLCVIGALVMNLTWASHCITVWAPVVSSQSSECPRLTLKCKGLKHYQMLTTY